MDGSTFAATAAPGQCVAAKPQVATESADLSFDFKETSPAANLGPPRSRNHLGVIPCANIYLLPRLPQSLSRRRTARQFPLCRDRRRVYVPEVADGFHRDFSQSAHAAPDHGRLPEVSTHAAHEADNDSGDQSRKLASTRRAWTPTSSAATTSACSGSKANLATSARSPRRTAVLGFITTLTPLNPTALAPQSYFPTQRSTSTRVISSVFSAMVNGSLDFGGNGGFGGYVGGGVGDADVHQFGSSNGKFAWQSFAGAPPVSRNSISA